MRMRLRIVALAVAGVAVAAALSSPAPAQAPAQAEAEASIVAGDLGVVGNATAQDGRDEATGSANRSGMEILQGRSSVRATRKGGDAQAAATAVAEGVTLFGGLVSAERVTQTAADEGGGATITGAVTGLVVDGVAHGNRTGTATFSGGGARVSVNSGGAGLTVRLTRAVAGFASGTTVRVAEVRAEATDGADPAATPTPQPSATPDDPLDPGAGDDDPAGEAEDEPAGDDRPKKPKVSPAERLARGRFVFPVYGDVRCADDFGAPRQVEIGSHQGNDCFAAFGSPVLAVADGTLNRVGTLPISGNRLWLKTERGDAFFYAHLSAFGPEAVSGRKVKAGTLLGFVGNTGDAEPTPPHVHFEIHPGDKDAIDPHEILTAWQARGAVPTGGWLARYGTDTEERPGALVEVRDFIAGE
jgi:murein DD-endopeptidase MepM/ murein hydrolase activator NlpD